MSGPSRLGTGVKVCAAWPRGWRPVLPRRRVGPGLLLVALAVLGLASPLVHAQNESTTRDSTGRFRREPIPRSSRQRSMRSSASPRSRIVNAGFRPLRVAYARRICCPTAWKVPPRTCCARRSPHTAATRRSMSPAARRVMVRRRIRSGATPRSISTATRATKVFVLPVPAPAMTSRGPSPWQTARL